MRVMLGQEVITSNQMVRWLRVSGFMTMLTKLITI